MEAFLNYSNIAALILSIVALHYSLVRLIEVRKLRELYHKDKIESQSTEIYITHNYHGRCRVIGFLNHEQARVFPSYFGATDVVIELKDTDYQP